MLGRTFLFVLLVILVLSLLTLSSEHSFLNEDLDSSRLLEGASTTSHGTSTQNPEKTASANSSDKAADLEKEHEHEEQEGHENLGPSRYSPSDPEFYLYLAISAFLCIGAGYCSGLTVGYLSIDELQLELKLKNGTEEEKRAATKIMPILQKHHVLLSTLLIANALCLESLPIFLEHTLPPAVTIVLSTVFVVVFSEILPQALCTGPQQLMIAEKMAPLTKVSKIEMALKEIIFLFSITQAMMVIFGVVAYPLGAFLDYLLGVHHSTRFPRKDLKALIQLHELKKHRNITEHDDEDASKEHHHEVETTQKNIKALKLKISKPDGALTREEIDLIVSTIDLRDRMVEKVMVNISDVFMIGNKEKVTRELIQRILAKGYSKIPIHEHSDKNNIVGILKVKNLIESPEKLYNNTIAQVGHMQIPLLVSKDTSMFEMLMIFQEKKASIALVTDEVRKGKGSKAAHPSDEIFFSRRNLIIDTNLNKNAIIGLVSLKDVYEEMLSKELKDDDLHMSLTGLHPKKLPNHLAHNYNSISKLKVITEDVTEAVERQERTYHKK